MARLDKVKIDDAGRWFMYYVDPDGGADIELNIGSTASAAFKRAQRKLAKAHLERNPSSRFSGVGTIPEKALQSMQVELALELLHGWRGIEKDGPDGVPVEDKYSPERAREILNDPGYSDLVEFIHECGANLAAHAAEITNEAVGNSQTASGS